MAAAIRKSGGIVAFHWQGKLQDPATPGFAEALAQRRFRTIENAASEEISVGWVTKADPTGDTFALEDLDGGAGTWLRVRLDKKTLPKKWLQIHRDAAEKSRGKKLSARERRELKDDLTEKLLPRVLPAVNLVDALLFFDRRLILLFATSRSVVEAFGKLFFETFSLPLERQNPRLAGLQLKLGAEAERSLDRLEPVRWPRGEDGDGRPRSVPKPVRATALDDEEDGDDADRRRNKTADGDDTPPWQEQDA